MRTALSLYLWCLVTLTLILHAPTVISRDSGRFVLKDEFRGHNFYDGWNWETFNDPTHGRVDYVSQSTSRARNLSFATDDKFIMRADDQNEVYSGLRGRASNRISSKAAYGDMIIVLDLAHMPEGCSTWPAFWVLSQKGPWPRGGEIDIVEGVHRDTRNLASMHTLPNCTMPQQRFQTGQTTSTNCDVRMNSNEGCGVKFAKPGSYGAPFNAAGGGYFVLRRTAAEGAAVWFWSREDPTIPPEVRGDLSNISVGIGRGRGLLDTLVNTPRTIEVGPWWGLPEAEFPPHHCDESHFDEMMMIFDLTFCGDWAGSVWATSGCGLTACERYVDNYPDAFKNAYWEINSVRVYTPA